MAVCPVDPMHDAPMMSAMPKDCALLLGGAGCHPNIFHPNNRATGQPSIRMRPEGCHFTAGNDGRMAVCPVDPMVDDPMISALMRDGAMYLVGRIFYLNNLTTNCASLYTIQKGLNSIAKEIQTPFMAIILKHINRYTGKQLLASLP